MNHRDTETQRRKGRREKDEERPESFPLLALPSSALLCVSVSLWFIFFLFGFVSDFVLGISDFRELRVG
jgi:hypothetical protein